MRPIDLANRFIWGIVILMGGGGARSFCRNFEQSFVSVISQFNKQNNKMGLPRADPGF